MMTLHRKHVYGTYPNMIRQLGERVPIVYVTKSGNYKGGDDTESAREGFPKPRVNAPSCSVKNRLWR